MTAPKLLSALAVATSSGTDVPSSNHVTLTFDQSMELSSLLDPLRYSFDGGLLCSGAMEVPLSTTRVTLVTTTQILGRAYRVFVSGIVENTSGELLNQNADTSTFSGYGSSAEYVVQDLVAMPNPAGSTIDLLWNDPPAGAPEKVIIFRRPRSWIFDETDPGTVVYSGDLSGIDSDPLEEYDRFFQDSGNSLVGDEFYYYTVAISLNPAAGFSEMAVSDRSRARSLCVGTFNAEGWLRARIPFKAQERDVEEADSFLAEPIALMSDWLTILRSSMRASLAAGAWTRTPHEVALGLTRSVGLNPPCGESYDFDTVRRALIRLTPRWGKKGRNDNLVEVVKILVGWLAVVQEFGVWERSRLFGTYDPDSRRTDGQVSDISDITRYGLTDDGRTPWQESEWAGSRLLDGFGNWIDVSGNGATSLTFSPESASDRRLLLADLPLGQQYVEVESVFGVSVGQRVQIHDPATGNAEVIQVCLVQGNVRRLYFWNVLDFEYDTDSYVSFQITKPVARMVGTVNASTTDSIEVAVPGGSLSWETNQWAGFILCDSGGTYRTVVSNTSDTLTFDDGLTSPSGEFALARSYSGTDVGILHFWVYYGHTPRLYNPLFDNTLRGTRFDPYYYLYSGRSGSRLGRWGSCDMGVYILSSDAVVVASRWTSVGENYLTDTSANWSTDELVGMYLNPNQNQTNLLLIVANTNDTVTVAGRVDSLAVSGQAYVVFTARNAARYRALVSALPSFVMEDVHPRVLFF